MSETQTQTALNLRTFTERVETLIQNTRFESGSFADQLWMAMRPHAEAGLARLKEGGASLDVRTPEAAKRFGHIRDFSETTLEWCLEDDLALIEALSDTPLLLLGRLQDAGLLSGTPAGVSGR